MNASCRLYWVGLADSQGLRAGMPGILLANELKTTLVTT